MGPKELEKNIHITWSFEMNRNRTKASTKAPKRSKKKKSVVVIFSIIVFGICLLFFALYYSGHMPDLSKDSELLNKAKKNLKEIIKEDELQYGDEKESPDLGVKKHRPMRAPEEQKTPPKYSDEDRDYLDKLME